MNIDKLESTHRVYTCQQLSHTEITHSGFLLCNTHPVMVGVPTSQHTSSSSRMRVIYHNWSAMKQRPHPQSVAEISHHSVLSGGRI